MITTRKRVLVDIPIPEQVLEMIQAGKPVIFESRAGKQTVITRLRRGAPKSSETEGSDSGRHSG